nr:hypothetical protein [Streptomyces sp. NK08204]
MKPWSTSVFSTVPQAFSAIWSSRATPEALSWAFAASSHALLLA